MTVVTTINWANGDVTQRFVNFDDTAERRRFAHVSRAALEAGGTVTTVRKDFHPDYAKNIAETVKSG